MGEEGRGGGEGRGWEEKGEGKGGEGALDLSASSF